MGKVGWVWDLTQPSWLSTSRNKFLPYLCCTVYPSSFSWSINCLGFRKEYSLSSLCSCLSFKRAVPWRVMAFPPASPQDRQKPYSPLPKTETLLSSALFLAPQQASSWPGWRSYVNPQLRINLASLGVRGNETYPQKQGCFCVGICFRNRPKELLKFLYQVVS